jgi:hypothetical protein
MDVLLFMPACNAQERGCDRLTPQSDMPRLSGRKKTR